MTRLAAAAGFRPDVLGRVRDVWKITTVALLAAVLGPASALYPAWTVAFALGVVLLLIAVRDLAVAVVLFIPLTFVEEIPGVPNASVSVVKLGGMVLALAWLLRLTDRDRTRPLFFRDHPVLAYAAVFLVVWALASRLWALDPELARSSALRLAQGPLLLLIVYSAIRTRDHLRWAVWAFVGGAYFSALTGLFWAFVSGGVTQGRLVGGGTGNDLAAVQNPNDLAAILVPGVALAIFALPTIHGSLKRWVLVSLGAASAFALFLTQSRGGLVAFGVVFAATLFLAGPARSRAVAAVLIVAAAGISYFALFAPASARSHVTYFADAGSSGRSELWRTALEMTRDRPLRGVGAGNFVEAKPGYAAEIVNLRRVDVVVDEPLVVHNTYLEVLSELGAVGLLAFLVVIVGSLLAGLGAVRRLARLRDRDSEMLGRGLVIATLGLLAAYTFISAEYEKQLWLLVGLTAAVASVARNEMRRAEIDGFPATAGTVDGYVGGPGTGRVRRRAAVRPAR